MSSGTGCSNGLRAAATCHKPTVAALTLHEVDDAEEQGAADVHRGVVLALVVAEAVRVDALGGKLARVSAVRRELRALVDAAPSVLRGVALGRVARRGRGGVVHALGRAAVGFLGAGVGAALVREGGLVAAASAVAIRGAGAVTGGDRVACASRCSVKRSGLAMWSRKAGERKEKE